MSPHMRIVCALAVPSILAGCPNTDKKPSGSSPDAAPTMTVVLSAPTARPSPPARASGAPESSAGLERYPNEVSLGESPARVNHDMFVRRGAVKSSDKIAAVRAGTDVVKLARRGQWILVRYEDPKQTPTQVLGWVWDKAFDPLSGPGDDDKLCACYKKLSDAATCDAIAGSALGECDRTYKDDCKKLLACTKGEIMPTCEDKKERLVFLGPADAALRPGHCVRTCKGNAGCPNDHVCTDKFGAPSVCVRAKTED